ncbi:hypothetical protein GJU41_22035 [Bacillus idriensis]|uniref:Uncharacterized protein n=1 Tax=Metabacillus idriensis TaxID=324768 RepID=A0A6I2MFP7_9BACI|nr:hypothetical protein [Metabacillus idriensis]MRX56629.1 hypothetical protein [Metabacillus idriensis]
MTIFPEEIGFLSLFECEPTLFDNTSNDLPFYNNIAKYKFSNGEENFVVTISPADGEVKIRVSKRESNRLISLLELKRVNKFEITSDKKDFSSVLLTVQNEDSQQMIEIDFKPYFKLIIKEHS